MAGASLLTLIDDIATVLDDVSILTKVAAKKTAGVLGDDLALNAQQVSGVRAERELPVVWAVAKGSAVNKLILVPAALALSTFFPVAITPLLMLGGAYLCFEGFEKVAHKLFHSKAEDKAAHREQLEALKDPDVDLVEFEKQKIKGAIRTDFILSAEIIVIALGTVQSESLGVRIGVVTAIAAIMTVGVYGLVAGIVKLDDLGMHWLEQKDAIRKRLGALILRLAPWLMKTLGIVGTAAMFLVGGGILVHGIPSVGELLHYFEHLVETLPAGAVLKTLIGLVFNGIAGVLAGGIVLALVKAGSAIVGRIRGAK